MLPDSSEACAVALQTQGLKEPQRRVRNENFEVKSSLWGVVTS